MKRKVLCNRDVCALDRLPDQQFGGGLRVQSPDYVVPLSRTTRVVSRTLVGKGKVRKKRSTTEKSKSKKNKRSRSGKRAVSRKRTTKKKRHGK
jgi:hypothetical protein